MIMKRMALRLLTKMGNAIASMAKSRIKAAVRRVILRLDAAERAKTR